MLVEHVVVAAAWREAAAAETAEARKASALHWGERTGHVNGGFFLAAAGLNGGEGRAAVL